MIYSKLPKGIWALALINFINGAGNFIFPFLTLFLTIKLGYSATYAGIFTMISLSMYVPGSLFSSHIADKVSRKKVMIISQILCGMAMILCGLMMEQKEIVPYLMLLIFLFDGATDPARAAIHADHTTFNNRKEAFSLFYLAYNIGFAIGPMIAGILFNNYPKWLFLGNGIITLFATLCVAFLIEDKKPTDKDLDESMNSNQSDKAVEGSIFKVFKERPLLLTYIGISSIFGVGIAMAFFALPLYLTDLFDSFGPAYYGRIMSLNAITVIICTPLLVRFSSNKHPLRLISFSMILYIISYLTMGYVNTFFFIAGLVVLFSIGEVFSATNHSYFVMNQTPLGHRARFSSIQSILEGAGFAVGPLLGGAIIDNHGFLTIFITSSSLLIFCLFALQLIRIGYSKKDGTKY